MISRTKAAVCTKALSLAYPHQFFRPSSLTLLWYKNELQRNEFIRKASEHPKAEIIVFTMSLFAPSSISVLFSENDILYTISKLDFWKIFMECLHQDIEYLFINEKEFQLDSLLLCFWLKRSQYVLHQAFLKEHKQKVVPIICTQFHNSRVENLSDSHLSHSSKKSRKGLIFCWLYIQLTFYFVSIPKSMPINETFYPIFNLCVSIITQLLEKGST